MVDIAEVHKLIRRLHRLDLKQAEDMCSSKTGANSGLFQIGYDPLRFFMCL